MPYVLSKGSNKLRNMVDWYMQYLGLHKSGSPHLGVIVEVSCIIWYKWFKHNKFESILDITNFAVVYTPTSIEVGEGITTKFSYVDFASSKDCCSCVPTSQLVVALHLYGVLMMVTVLRYGSHVTVTL